MTLDFPNYKIQVYDYVTEEIVGSDVVVPTYKEARIKRRAIVRKLQAAGDDFLGVRIIHRGMAGDKVVLKG